MIEFHFITNHNQTHKTLANKKQCTYADDSGILQKFLPEFHKGQLISKGNFIVFKSPKKRA